MTDAVATTAPRGWETGSNTHVLHRLLRRPISAACLTYLVLLILVGVLAPILLPDVADARTGDLYAAAQGPSPSHLLGTDMLGRDVVERLLVGTRVTLIGVAQATIVVVALGVPLGVVAGFMGGLTDRVIGWISDLVFSMPNIVIVLVVLAVFPQSMTAAMVTFGVITAPNLLRVVRAATLPLRSQLYIDATQVAGLSRWYVVTRHVLPRVSGPAIVQVSLIAATALLVQSGLAFLRLVVEAPAPSWGGMIADGMGVLQQQPWLIWPPGIIMATTILALGLLGDSLRDAHAEPWSAAVRKPGRERSVELALPTSDAPAADAGVALLAVRNLSVSIPTKSVPVRIVQDLSFDVGAGECVGLVGESGCGKSITSLAILGLLPAGGYVESGRILLRGQDLTTMSERQLQSIRGSKIALVSQEPMIGLNPAFRVGWQLAELVRRHQNVSRTSARAQAISLLEMVNLPDPHDVVRRFPHELSGGMAQRVAIARALAGEPDLLIADEPTTALDVTVQAEILHLLRDLQEQRELGLLLVTHDWGVIADICDRAVVMYAGEVVESADIASLFSRPMHPYTDALLKSDPHASVGGRRLPTVPGSVLAPGQWPSGCHFEPRCGLTDPTCAEAPVPLIELSSVRSTRCIRHDAMRSA